MKKQRRFVKVYGIWEMCQAMNQSLIPGPKSPPQWTRFGGGASVRPYGLRAINDLWPQRMFPQAVAQDDCSCRLVCLSTLPGFHMASQSPIFECRSSNCFFIVHFFFYLVHYYFAPPINAKKFTTQFGFLLRSINIPTISYHPSHPNPTHIPTPEWMKVNLSMALAWQFSTVSKATSHMPFSWNVSHYIHSSSHPLSFRQLLF